MADNATAECRWTGALASFLDHLSRHFMTRVNAEQSPGFKGGSSDDEGAEGMELDGHPGTPPACTPRANLSLETQHRIARLIVKLASRSQYAKVRNPSQKALHCPV